MKKLSVILAVVMALGLVVTACSSDDGNNDSDNDCVKAANVMLAGLDEACSGKDDCAFCKCWNDGHKSLDTDGETCVEGQTTECTDDPNTEVDECACEGQALEAAKACLADEAACKKPMQDMVAATCQAGE